VYIHFALKLEPPQPQTKTYYTNCPKLINNIRNRLGTFLWGFFPGYSNRDQIWGQPGPPSLTPHWETDVEAIVETCVETFVETFVETRGPESVVNYNKNDTTFAIMFPFGFQSWSGNVYPNSSSKVGFPFGFSFGVPQMYPHMFPHKVSTQGIHTGIQTCIHDGPHIQVFTHAPSPRRFSRPGLHISECTPSFHFQVFTNRRCGY
jgi:hypothetical protein